MSRRRVLMIAVGVIAAAAVAGYAGGQIGYRAEIAKARAQEAANASAREARVKAAEQALQDSRNLSEDQRMLRSLNYLQAKNEGRILPCGDKWKEFTVRFGVTEHFCEKGHVFQETRTGNFVPTR